jgi:uncharacterized protein
MLAPRLDWDSLSDDSTVALAPLHEVSVGDDAVALISRKESRWVRLQEADWSFLRRLLERVTVGELRTAGAWTPLLPVLARLYSAGLLSVDGAITPRPKDPATSHKPSTLMLKMTGACDLACTYCYDYAAERWTGQLDLDLAKRLIMECLDPSRPLQLMFHGGEPLLCFRQLSNLVEFAEKESAARGCAVRHSLQTNGLALNEDIIQFLERHEFDVGISCDGPAPLHDRHRIDHNARGTFERLIDKVRQFPRFMLTKVGYLTVPTPETVSRLDEAWTFFRELGARTWKIVPLDPQGRADLVQIGTGPVTRTTSSTKEDDYRRQLIDFLEARLDSVLTGQEPGPPFLLNLVQLTALFICQQSDDVCMQLPCGAGRQLLVLDAQGCVRACDAAYKDEFLLDRTPKERESVVQFAVSSAAAAVLQSREEWLLNESPCRDCPWLRYCGGACPGRALLRHGTIRAVDEMECHTRLRLLPKILADVSATDSALRRYYEARRPPQ